MPGWPLLRPSLGAAAYRKWTNRGAKPAPAPASGTDDPPTEIKLAAGIVTVTECLRMNMLLAMISASGADGRIDGRELALLRKAIDEASVSSRVKATLTRMLNQPPPLEEIAMGATSPLEACELYGAALGVIEEDSPANTLFLRRFAAASH